MSGRTDESNPFYGKTHSVEFKAKISIPKSEKTKAKISVTKGGNIIYIYDTHGSLVNSFCSARKAAEIFNCGYNTILKYLKSSKLFQKQWILFISAIKQS